MDIKLNCWTKVGKDTSIKLLQPFYIDPQKRTCDGKGTLNLATWSNVIYSTLFDLNKFPKSVLTIVEKRSNQSGDVKRIYEINFAEKFEGFPLSLEYLNTPKLFLVELNDYPFIWGKGYFSKNFKDEMVELAIKMEQFGVYILLKYGGNAYYIEPIANQDIIRIKHFSGKRLTCTSEQLYEIANRVYTQVNENVDVKNMWDSEVLLENLA